MSSNPLVSSFRFVNSIPEGAAHPTVVKALRDLTNSTTDLQTSIPLLQKQLDDLKTSTTTAASTQTIVENITQNPFAGLGSVNNESSETSYTTQTSDNGILLIFSDASAVAVTLNFAVSAPWFCFAVNWGAGVVTFTPQSGNISYIGNLAASSMPLTKGYLTMIVFDGTNFWAATLPTVPQTFNAITHEFLISYDATTGLFTAAQPAFTDISGTATSSQGGTGINSSASTGVAQVSAGTWSISAALANGTTGTTQTANDNSTKVATTAYVDGTLPRVKASTTLTGQTGAIGTTAIYTPSAAGSYRVTFVLWITTVGTGGTISATASSNNGAGGSSNFYGTSGASTTVLGAQVQAALMFHVAAGQAINYSTSFSSVTGSPVYSLDIIVEQLK